MSFPKECHEYLDKKLKDYDHLKQEVSQLEQKNIQLKQEVRMIQEDAKNCKIRMLFEHIRKNEPEFRLE